jgi:hypothetical protein
MSLSVKYCNGTFLLENEGITYPNKILLIINKHEIVIFVMSLSVKYCIVAF